ncbi:host nuclease inhibitor GamL [Cronobacter sakazakii]|uniref:host nuclease inhibitor GamL n=1 Tax=Cronobacter sakazakii TaxID=28141 RepID=UPI000CFC8280|nr:host nuclease inhibitor GamL [Cronobacter sakazakii]PQX84103.1 host nuclease inhibitor GamL [Cronobacter sakazakii]PQY01726.1 host nuclease inhibitor GamL [Cronobacter sakazakii]PQY37141.1 host nuclease inhibitor GamL [Cronobacter sakazakii]PQY56391.1 host nuclease inhibitor GamL [Cronobacter sakazakii]
MQAYRMQDRAEHQRAAVHQAELEKQAWVDNRAEELLKLYPALLIDFASTSSLLFEIRSHFYTTKAGEAYNAMIHTLAWQQAEDDWELAFGWSANLAVLP